jgi:hypothetical protein
LPHLSSHSTPNRLHRLLQNPSQALWLSLVVESLISFGYWEETVKVAVDSTVPSPSFLHP